MLSSSVSAKIHVISASTSSQLRFRNDPCSSSALQRWWQWQQEATALFPEGFQSKHTRQPKGGGKNPAPWEGGGGGESLDSWRSVRSCLGAVASWCCPVLTSLRRNDLVS